MSSALRYFLVEKEQAEIIGTHWVERENTEDTKGFLRWEGIGQDIHTHPQAKMQSIFPRIFGY
jgi:hypothetical protein